MSHTSLQQLIEYASDPPRRQMRQIIDTFGNKLAVLCSDDAAVEAICELFRDTALGPVFSGISQNCPTVDSKALFFKGILVADAIRLIQCCIYADDVVQESELDATLYLLKPLAQFLSVSTPDIYRRFSNLNRISIIDFLHVHCQETGLMGGSIKLSREIMSSPQRIATLSVDDYFYCIEMCCGVAPNGV